MKTPPRIDGWCFALINGRFGEIYFKKPKCGPRIIAHCYVTRDEFTKLEQKMIDHDIKKHQFTWKHKKYKLVKKLQVKLKRA